ncbi:hypothetical protein [Niallia sp. FSL R7-0271]|uniref:hypothetical protein n=1 Tax=Niallia sp. FSL R7-0271 TaxID=2921678 RepID=UPI0030FA6A3D
MANEQYTLKKTCFNNTEENKLVELYSLSKESIKEVNKRTFHEVTILMSAIREESPARSSLMEEKEVTVSQEIAFSLCSDIEESLFINKVELLIN